MRLLALLILLGGQAHAAVHFDPYVSGSMGTWDSFRAQVGVETEMKGDSTSFGYGARLAFSWKWFFIGGEYGERQVLWLYHKMPDQSADDNWEGRVSGKERMFGPFIGLKNEANTWFVWFGMYSSDELSFFKDQDPVEPSPSYKGKSTNVGFARKLGSWLMVGFEYQHKEFDTLSQRGRKVDLPGVGAGGTMFSPLKRDEYQAFISIPFIFFNK